MDTYLTIKEILPLLYINRLEWAANQESKKHFSEFLNSQVVNFLGGNDLQAQQTVYRLESELTRRTLSECRDIETIRILSHDIIELLSCQLDVMNGYYSLLGVFHVYAHHVFHRQDKVNRIVNNKSRSPDEELFLKDFDTLFNVRNALFGWAEVLINHVRKTTPNLYEQYAEGFREFIDYRVPTVSPPLLPTDRQRKPLLLDKDFLILFPLKQEAEQFLTLMGKVGLLNADSQWNLGPREVYKLMALVEASQQKTILPPAANTARLTKAVAKQIGLPINRARNSDRKKYDDALQRFIKLLNDGQYWPMKADKMAFSGR